MALTGATEPATVISLAAYETAARTLSDEHTTHRHRNDRHARDGGDAGKRLSAAARPRHRGHCDRRPRLSGRFRFANLPTGATLDDFDLDAIFGIDRSLLAELGTCRYLETATDVLLIGPPGVCKTHIATGPGHAAVTADYRTYFTSAADLAARCHRAAIEGKWGTMIRFFPGPTLLVVDLCRLRDAADVAVDTCRYH
ncbi:ATP-binding protein [Cryobacterium sp. Sr3]|uniref:ATP-binding protein n=1 Tax=Cryobacterium sp. Sr3 TaxID=1259194 RepID=UPI001F540EE9|nr:ATP-binding protein [Cryobacterium sp. Sr3]